MNALDVLTRADALAPLTVRQLKLLLYLAGAGPQQFGDVRLALGFSNPSLSRSADALARAKLLVRLPSPDRRVPVLALTDEGKALAAELAGAP